ncbi:MAG: hypothetical protein JSR09_05515 [Bacteroidetes bacterium]|nr:hypothetical protein [Bacteroidota bacterium]MBS1649146.1 hypothetical protein [Bacteroidota bacterium]
MQFKDIIGLTETKQQLIEMLAQNRLSHALLFLGNEGSGALPLALAFAQLIVSQPQPAPVVEDLFGGMTALEPTQTFIPPNEIQNHSSFQRAEQLIHPDLHFSYPVVSKKSGDKPTSKDFITEWREFVKNYPYGNVYDWLQMIGAENKQGNITAEECNDILKKLSLKSFESEYKVLLLWMPEYLKKEGNKLLKLIEEPPANTIFILVAENDEQVLPTILSRCQLIKIPKPTTKEIEEALLTKANANAETAKQVASICDGNYREALQLLQHAEEDWQSLLREWLKAILREGPIAQVKFSEEISKTGRENQKQLLRYFTHLFEQSLRIRLLGADNIILTEKEKDFATRLNKITNINQQQCIIDELDKATYYIERNANGKILFQALSIKLFHIIQNKVSVEV